MTDDEVHGASRPSRRLMIFSITAALLLAMVLPLVALTLNAVKVAGFPLGFWFAAQGSILGLIALTLVFARRAGGDAPGEGLRPALAMAGETVGAAGILGFLGITAALGFDGLAFPLGLTAGLTVATIFIAPRFSLYPVRSSAGFFAARFGGATPRRIALAITAIATVLLLAADLRAVAFAVQSLTGTDYVTGVAVATVALAAVWLSGVFLRIRGLAALGFVFVFAATAIVLAAFAFELGYLPLPHAVYGQALSDLAADEQNLIIKKLADVKSLKPMTSPFLQQSMLNFAGLLLGLALGGAVLPQLIGRHLSMGVVSPGGATRRAAWATVFAGLFLTGVPAFATFARVSVAKLFANGMETAALPSSVVEVSRLGWAEVCGTHAATVADLAAACAKVSGTRGFLRLQDVTFSNDAYLFTAAATSGMASWTGVLLALSVIVAGAIVAHGLVAGLLRADAEARRAGSTDPEGLELRSAILALSLLLGGLVVASFSGLELSALISEGLALIAAGLFPAVILGLFWRRMSAAGAAAAMIAGFAVAAIYIAGVRLFPVTFFDWTGDLSTASASAVRKFADLKAAVSAAAEAGARDAAEAQLTRHAGTIANWWGLRPGAAALLGLPAGLLAGIATSLIGSKRDKAERAPG
jgi:putative solute:sodium symporter small subunit